MDRKQRQAQQREKYAAMSGPRKVATYLYGVVAGGLTCLLIGYFLSGELRFGFSVVMGLALSATNAATTAFMYRDAR